MDLPCEGQVLLVGDGDFTFTLSLIKKGTLEISQVRTSNFETLTSISQHKLAGETMKTLTEMGVGVFLEADACELHTHPVIKQVHYQRIIFNFPLADRHNIKKNRALLADFFSSCRHILSDEGQVMVTLCRGQGGTPADQPMRSWHDSWQACSMATNAGFVLRDIQPFEASKYPEYHSVGFRFQDKSFSTDGALTHIFEKANMVVCDENVGVRGVVASGGNSYTCSRYVAQKMSRNLLHETNNPLCLLKKRLETSFSFDFGAKAITERHDWCILPGHKSKVVVEPRHFTAEEIKDTEMSEDCNEISNSGDCLSNVKKRKNEVNIKVMRSTKNDLLVHGVNRSATPDSCETFVTPHNDQVSHFQEWSLQDLNFIPKNSENVFILIKGTNENTTNENFTDSGKSITEESNTSEIKTVGSIQDDRNLNRIVQAPSASGNNLEGCPVDVKTQDLYEMQEMNINDESGRGNGQIQNCIGRVYHCRTSLLENLSDLFVHMHDNKSENCQNDLSKSIPSPELPSCSRSQFLLSSELTGSFSNDKSIDYCGSILDGQDLSKICEVTSSAKICETSPSAKTGETLSSAKISEGSASAKISFPEMTSRNSHCCVFSATCFRPGPIVPEMLTVRHEMMFVQTVPTNVFTNIPMDKLHAQSTTDCNGSSRDTSLTTNNSKNDPGPLESNTKNTKEAQNFLLVSDKFVECLKRSGLFPHISLGVLEIISKKDFVKIDGFENVSSIKVIYIKSEPSAEESHPESMESDVVAGVMFTAERCSSQILVCILQLDNIICKIHNISNPRLLWSTSKKFTDQFQVSTFPQRFTPFSLYPMMFVHDLSFWQKDAEFDDDEMYRIIQNVAGDLIIRVSLIDLYTDPNSGQQSRCYRLYFMSFDQALSYLVSWKLQSFTRMEIAQKLGVTLR